MDRDTRFELAPPAWKAGMLAIEHQSRLVISQDGLKVYVGIEPTTSRLQSQVLYHMS